MQSHAAKVIGDELERSSTKDTTNRHGRDERLRRFGFKIHSRPTNSEPIWEKNNHTISEHEAHLIVTKSIRDLDDKIAQVSRGE